MKVAAAESATRLLESELFAAREETISARRETVSVWRKVVSVKRIVAAQADDIETTGRKLRECERQLASVRNASLAAAAVRLQGEGQVRTMMPDGEGVLVNSISENASTSNVPK